MGACDAIVTKAGPGTIAESLISGLPMVLNGFIPCQEAGNVPFVLDNQVPPPSCLLPRPFPPPPLLPGGSCCSYAGPQSSSIPLSSPATRFHLPTAFATSPPPSPLLPEASCWNHRGLWIFLFQPVIDNLRTVYLCASLGTFRGLFLLPQQSPPSRLLSLFCPVFPFCLSRSHGPCEVLFYSLSKFQYKPALSCSVER